MRQRRSSRASVCDISSLCPDVALTSQPRRLSRLSCSRQPPSQCLPTVAHPRSGVCPFPPPSPIKWGQVAGLTKWSRFAGSLLESRVSGPAGTPFVPPLSSRRDGTTLVSAAHRTPLGLSRFRTIACPLKSRARYASKPRNAIIFSCLWSLVWQAKRAG